MPHLHQAGGKLFFDKRDSSSLNLLTVNETAPDPNEEKDAVNSIAPLCVEATSINQNFSQQVLVKGGEKLRFESPNPFASEEDELASCAYRYRKWCLNEEEGVEIIVRCELDAAIQVKGEDQLLSVKALNETDLRSQVRLSCFDQRCSSRSAIALLARIGARRSRHREVPCWPSRPRTTRTRLPNGRQGHCLPVPT